MLTSEWQGKEDNFFTHHFRSLKCIRFVKIFFFVANNGEGGGEILDYVPCRSPIASWLDQTDTMHN